tara:strand:+ start:63 stop:542 length:480 start_codon:yes stop_codon:yes gene_type:complete
MADRKSLNLEKIEKGSNLVITKGSFKEGKDCKNGAIMFGVEYYGADANLFIHPGRDTNAVIDKLEETDEGVEITLYHNNDGSYGISNGTKSPVNGGFTPGVRDKSTNASIETQVKWKEIAPIMSVALQAGIDITEPLPEGFLNNINSIYLALQNADLPF